MNKNSLLMSLLMLLLPISGCFGNGASASVPGCTDIIANNFDLNATEDDGTCDFDLDPGCTDIIANNFDLNATEDDGTCDFDLDDDGILDSDERYLISNNVISLGSNHGCVILADGGVGCWGSGSGGRLGDGTENSHSEPTATESLGDNVSALELATGQYHSCALLETGLISCWGRTVEGALGIGDPDSDGSGDIQYSEGFVFVPTPTNSFGEGRTAVEISAAQWFTCAILDDGNIACWGRNDHGNLGTGDNAQKFSPSIVSNLGEGRTAKSISAGNNHVCAILDDGSVSCWGSNYYGGLGNGDSQDRFFPTPTVSLGEGRVAVEISSGYIHTCAILDDGSVSCWGGNSWGQLGDAGESHEENESGSSSAPETSGQFSPSLTGSLGEGRSAVAIASGDFHTCVILDDGSVSCWGKPTEELPTLVDFSASNVFSAINWSESKAVAISAEAHQTCVVVHNAINESKGASILCFELGDNLASQSDTPEQYEPQLIGERLFDDISILLTFAFENPTQ